MSSGRKWFILCAALVFLVGFLSGIIVSPLILKPKFGHKMGMGMKRDIRPDGPGMDMEMGPEGHHGMKPGEGGRPPMGPGGVHGMRDGEMIDRIVADLGEQLSLTTDQKKKLRKIFEDSEPELMAFQKQMRNRLRDIRKKMDSRITEMLDDNQKKKFRDISKRFDKEMP